MSGKVKEKKRIRLLLVPAVLIVVLAAGVIGKSVSNANVVKQRTKEIIQIAGYWGINEKKVEKPKEASVDFKELQKENSDIYAWIYVPDTVINYPVLQNEDDEDYYLDHNLDGSKGYPACIYTHPRNDKRFNDPDTVIYGHNMKDGSMFGNLKNYLDDYYAEGHKKLFIYTPQKVIEYRFVSAYKSDDKLILDYYDDFKEEEDFKDYLSEVSENSPDNAVLGTEDRLITLSTCTNKDVERLLVQFKKIEEHEIK